VLVVPQGHAERPVRRIAVAYDGGEDARRALRAAVALAQRLGATLVLVGVSDPPPGELPHLPDHELDRETTRAIRTVLERAASRLLPQGVVVSIRLPMGEPGPAIVQACEEDADLLVCGSHARGAMHSALVGSVSRHLVDHAPCAVLVVPRHTTIELVADEAPGGVRSAAS
jgi:nucleotide-binding universal stress UspA family protein